MTLFLILLLFVGGTTFAQSTPPAPMQYLMVDQHGKVKPEGYTAGLSEIAAAEAAAEAAKAKAEAVQAATAAASNVVNDVTEALTGAIGFGYVTGHVLSFAGAVEASEDATASVVAVVPGAVGQEMKDGVLHTGHYIWHVYSETMNSTPLIKYKTNLNATNAWEFAEYQSTAEFTDTTIAGVTYPIAYRSTVWLPSTLDTAFFIAFCEIQSGGQAGAFFDVIDGFTIAGKKGFTGTVEICDHLWEYKFGTLMSVTPIGGQ